MLISIIYLFQLFNIFKNNIGALVLNNNIVPLDDC
jgi:hypothetical protein